MVPTPLKAAVLLLSIVGSMTAANASADRVVLKDGTVEESDRVWESDTYVHFILKGTQAVEIRYAKEIVERIERADGVSHGISSERSGNITPNPTPSKGSAPSMASPDKAAASQGLVPPPATQMTEVKETELDRSIIERNRGLTLYDPRRPQRYWTDRQSKHATHAAAMAALAAQYERPEAWVEEHLGEENDLGAIHAHLIAAVEAEATPPKDQLVPADDADPLFHDPRRPLAYQTGINCFFDNRNEALNDLASQYRQPIEWVEANMGQSNTLRLVHENLARAASQGIARTASTELAPRKPAQVIPAGIRFYDPRRPEKYWASPADRYTSLREAIQSIAEAYGVPITHVETHMGDSNDLAQIHANIQRSLEGK
jgi:hypothetical protein